MLDDLDSQHQCQCLQMYMKVHEPCTLNAVSWLCLRLNTWVIVMDCDPQW